MLLILGLWIFKLGWGLAINNPFENQKRATDSIRKINQYALMKETAAVIHKEGYPIVKEKINRLDRLMELFHLISILNKYHDLFE